METQSNQPTRAGDPAPARAAESLRFHNRPLNGATTGSRLRVVADFPDSKWVVGPASQSGLPPVSDFLTASIDDTNRAIGGRPHRRAECIRRVLAFGTKAFADFQRPESRRGRRESVDIDRDVDSCDPRNRQRVFPRFEKPSRPPKFGACNRWSPPLHRIDTYS